MAYDFAGDQAKAMEENATARERTVIDDLGHRLEKESAAAAERAAMLERQARELRSVERACNIALKALHEKDPEMPPYG
jgi:hypothetical protein